MNVKQIVVLCGGTGSRLGTLTNNIPKPMLQVRGVPYLHLLLIELSRLPVDEIVLLTGYKGGVISRYFSGTIINGVTIKVLDESRQRGTLGALLEHFLHLDDRFLLCNGDTVWDYDVSNLFNSLEGPLSHFSYIFTVPNKSETRYGHVKCDRNNFVVDFSEKKSTSSLDYINAGMYLINKDHLQIFSLNDISVKLDIERNLFNDLSKTGMLKSIPNVIKDFFDFGTPEAFDQLDRVVGQKLYKRVIIFDRDNTINQDTGYISAPSPAVLCDSFVESLPILGQLDRHLIIVSNQGGIDLKKFRLEQSIGFYRTIKSQLARKGIFFLDYMFCPHHPSVQQCDCRKPSTGLIDKWIVKHFVNWSNLIVVGDGDADEKLAANLNAAFIRVERNGSYLNKLRSFLNDCN